MQYNIVQYDEPSPEFELIDRKRVNVGGAEFDEAFLCDLLKDYFTKQAGGIRPSDQSSEAARLSRLKLSEVKSI